MLWCVCGKPLTRCASGPGVEPGVQRADATGVLVGSVPAVLLFDLFAQGRTAATRRKVKGRPDWADPLLADSWSCAATCTISGAIKGLAAILLHHLHHHRCK